MYYTVCEGYLWLFIQVAVFVEMQEREEVFGTLVGLWSICMHIWCQWEGHPPIKHYIIMIISVNRTTQRIASVEIFEE